MARRKTAGEMTAGEQIGGTVFFTVYLLVLPFAAGPLFDLAAGLLGVTLSAAMRSALTYYLLFAVSVIVFHGFLARTSRRLAENAAGAVKTLGLGLVGLYGLNELAYRLSNLVIANRVNLNDTSISAQIDDAPRTTLLIVIVLAPFVEEVLFRGLMFRRMREYMRFLPAAFLSSLLFGLMYGNMVQFIYATLIGLLLAFIYEHYGNLRAVVLFHAIGNLTSGLSALFLTPQILSELPALPWIAAGAFLLAAGTGLLTIEKNVRPPVYRRPVFPAAEEEDKEADQKEI